MLRRGANPIIPCAIWEVDLDPVRLPPLPLLPGLTGESDAEIQLIKIAGLDNHLIGLTNQGHVLKFDALQSESTALSGSWQYVSDFYVG